jgi:polyphosphate kinase
MLALNAVRNVDATGVAPTQPAVRDRYLNRELSNIDFNARVLSLADDTGTPLLERVKFLAIFARNMDEFFQVRVAGLKQQAAAGIRTR